MADELVQIEHKGAVATVWLNRPASANALDTGLMRSITDAAESFQDDVNTRVVIFAGRGRHFSAGADLRARSDGPPPTLLQRRRGTRIGPRLIRALKEIPQITIAAVHGAALGGGCCIATACDFRIGTDDAVCGYPEIDRGMILQWQALPLCVHLVGPARAKRMVILGRHENAQTLLNWGFFDAVVARSELMQCAATMADEYAQKPPIAAQAIKHSINQISSALDSAVMHMDHDQFLLTTLSKDYAEAMQAYFEKRKGKFMGN